MKYVTQHLNLLFALAFSLTSLIFSQFATAESVYLRSAAPLDEPRGYCLDVAGWGVNARPDEPLRGHTCKYGEENADQIFRWVDEQTGHFHMPAYDRCLAAVSAEVGSNIIAAECENSDLQAWEFVPNGNLALREHPELCITMGETSSIAGAEILVSPGYKARPTTMQPCRDAGDPYQDYRWGRDDEFELSVANRIRTRMPADIQDGIRDFFYNGEGNPLPFTNSLYENVPQIYRQDEVKTTANLAYGEHEKQVLDVHVDTRRRGDELAPVFVYFHGGGYVRGAKENSHNVGEFFASVGMVGVSANYRLAPEFQWPEGANDVSAVVNWVTENIEEYQGDPNQIYLIGKSAAANHVATYAYRPELLKVESPAVAGVILISGNYRSTTEAYYGTENLDSKAILGNVSRGDIRTLLTTSEYESDQTKASALLLAAELAGSHGNVAVVRMLAGHNHFSPNLSIGTGDRMLSEEILDFALDAKK